MNVILLVIAVMLSAALGGVILYFLKQKTNSDKSIQELKTSLGRFASVTSVEEEVSKVRNSVKADLEQFQKERDAHRTSMETAKRELQEIGASVARLRQEAALLEEHSYLGEFAFYKPIYDFSTSQAYIAQLDKIRAQQKSMIQSKTAATCNVEWAVNNSKTEGRKQTERTLKLMLRAFNGECDAAISKVKYNNVHVMEERINKSFRDVNKMTEVQQAFLSPHYLDLKLQELRLMHEYQEKLYEEKEEQRRIREQLREEQIALREIEKAQEEAIRDKEKYARMLEKAREEAEKSVGEKQLRVLEQIQRLELLLAQAKEKHQRAISRAQLTKSGHVYVISNIGSFGENVFKIGMTRRLDPEDRVRELGDASVPFGFDVHAMIYSDDAPALENALHRAFQSRRLNQINLRREYFKVSIGEIQRVGKAHHGDIRFTLDAEAKEYRQTLAMSIKNTEFKLPVDNVITPPNRTDNLRYQVVRPDGSLLASVNQDTLQQMAAGGTINADTWLVDSNGKRLKANQLPGLLGA